MLKKINATGNPGCTLFNSECTISAGNTLRIGPGAQLSYTTQHAAVLTIFPLYLQTIIIDQMLSIGGEQ